MNAEEKLRLLWQRFVHQDATFTVQTHITDDRGNDKWIHLRQFRGQCTHTPKHRRGSCPDMAPIPLTVGALAKHLMGQQTVGVYQLKDNTVKWLCFDLDIRKDAEVVAGTLADHATRLRDRLNSFNLPHLVEYSGARGIHFWLFFAEPVQAAHALAFGKFLLGGVQIDEGFDIELFPKQAIANNLGNVVKLPLGVHRKTGTRCVILDPNTMDRAEDEWAALAQVGTIGPQSLARFLAAHKIDPSAYEYHGTVTRAGSGLPCYANVMEQGAVEGSRDEVTFRLACYLRDAGLPFALCVTTLREWNETKNSPPLYESELVAKIESAYSRDYSRYPCQSRAFDAYCDPKCPFYESKMETRRKQQGGRL